MDRGLSKLEVAVTSVCILATSVTAGSIFCFPIFGPSLTRDLGLSLTQTNTIWSGAVLGEYISAAFWGSLADRFGPNLLCVSAAVLFGSGYLLMSHADSTAIKMLESGQDIGILQSWHSPSGFVAMSAYFVLVGAGVAASYFSAVIASTRLFPSTPGLAISIPLTLFSLSSLFLSWIGTQFFVDPETGELNTPSFLTFLGVLLFCVNTISALAMRIGEKPQDPTTIQESESSNLRTDLESNPTSNSSEETPLLNNPTNPSKSILPGAPLTSSLASLLKAPSFLALALLLFVAVGGAEMVMSSVGAMTVSLLGSLGGKDQVDTFAKEVLRRGILISLGGTEIHSHSSDIDPGPKLGGEALRIRSAQVSLLALANTLARLSAGLASDLLTPNPLKKSTHQESNRASRNQRFGDQIRELFTKGKVPQSWTLSRMSLILFAMAVLLFAFVFSAFGLDSTDQLPMVSILTGVGYGLVFALIPSIMATAYGLAQFGRNWGIASYSCAAGSLSFSLLYATISDYVASQHPISKVERDEEESSNSGICYGNECFKASFVVATLGLLIAFLPIFQLWRKWRWFL